MGKALGDLEIVAVRFKRCELHVKGEGALCGYFLLAWTYLKGMLHEFSGCFIQNLKESPVYPNGKIKLVLKCYCFWLT
jgi:hypothetical protein